MYLNHRQLKAARCVLNLRVLDIGKLIETSRTTISKLENNIITLSEMRLSDRRNTILIEFFKQNSIGFCSNYSINFINDTHSQTEDTDGITRFQLRAARSILNKTQSELAEIMQVPPSTIKTAESYNNDTFFSPKDYPIVPCLIDTFLKEGLFFPNSFSVDFKKLVDGSFN